MADYSRAQLIQALRNADAAGDTPAAQAIARRIKAMEQPADFSGVTSRTLPAPEQPERSMAQELGRTFGLGTRATLEGIAGIPDIIAAPLTAGVNKLGAQVGLPRQSTFTEAATSFSDLLGLPKPETPIERVSSGITRAVSGAGGAIGTARQVAASAPGVTRQVASLLAAKPGAQVAGSAIGAGASELTREAGGGPGAQTAAGLVGALVPSGRVAAADAVSGALRNTVPEARKEVARLAQERGIQLTPVQLSDSRFLKWAQSMLRSVPFTGAQGRYQRQVGDFNRALAEEIGEQADNVGPQVYSRAKDRQSQAFDDLTSRNALRVDNQLIQSLSNIADNAKVSPTIAKEVESAIDSLYARATTGPGGVVIPGAAYQAFDSELNSIIKSGGPPAHFLGNVQSAVRRAMDASIRPEDAQAWRTLRQQYGARKTITGLAAKSEGGQISPPQLLGAATSTKAGKEAMASGRRGGIGDLARVGQLMKEPPSSGTAERISVSSALGGASLIDPVTGLLTAASLNLLSRGLDSRALARQMIRENPGLSLETAQAIIQRSAVPAAVVTQTQGNRR